MEEQINNINNSKKSELWNLTLKDLFFKYVRFLPLFLLSVAVALLVAFAYLRYTTRIYSASGSMAIKNDKMSGRGDRVEDMISGNNRVTSLQNEMEVLKSKPLMTRVVSKLQLQFGYTAKGKIKGLNVYKQAPFTVNAYEIADSSATFSINIKFVNHNQFRVNNEATLFTFNQLFKNSSGVFSLSRTGTPSLEAEYSLTWQPAYTVAASLVGGVKVQPKVPGTSILAISFQTTNPILASDIVNGLMAEYDSMTVEQNNYSTDQILNFIDARLNILDKELDTLQLAFLKYKQANNLIDIDKQLSNYFEKLTTADKDMVAQQFEVEQVNEIERYLQDKQNKFNRVAATALAVKDLTLNGLVTAYNKAQLDRQALLDADVPLMNPAVKELEGQIEKLRENLLENLKNIRASYASSMDVLKQRSSGEEIRLQTLPYKLREYIEMERQINTKRELYSLLEAKKEEASISRASTLSNSKIIDQALPSMTPVKPNKKTIQLMAVLIGLGLPALIIFMAEVLNDKITTRYDIESISSVPIIGEIGHSYSTNVMIVNKTNRSMVAEQFRIIRSNLQYVLSKNERPTILVTSSFSGEGKSFVSTNMGAVLALAGKKTIVLEFDIRKPKILSGLGMSRMPGISNFLVGKGELKDLIQPVPNQPNLFVLPCGPVPPNPSELLLDARVTEMFKWLREQFDVVVIDTAPVGMVSDAMTLGKFADCTLYLVRQGHTFKKQVALIDELYREEKLPRISIIINDVKVKPGYGYYGYGRYGYGYGYGNGQKDKSSYYEEETPPQSAIEKFFSKFARKKTSSKS